MEMGKSSVLNAMVLVSKGISLVILAVWGRADFLCVGGRVDLKRIKLVKEVTP